MGNENEIRSDLYTVENHDGKRGNLAGKGQRGPPVDTGWAWVCVIGKNRFKCHFYL